MIILLEAGRRLRKRRVEAEGSAAIEGAIFGLVGLLLAFTFSAAITRYDNHRLLLTEGVNDIGTAYLRLDLLPSQRRPELQQLFRDYTNSRLHLFGTVGPEISPETARLQGVIWQPATAAASLPGANPDATKLLLPAINNMIDITSTRRNAFNMHPPAVVFWPLFVFQWEQRVDGGIQHEARSTRLAVRDCAGRGGNADGVYDSGRGVSAAGIDSSARPRPGADLAARFDEVTICALLFTPGGPFAHSQVVAMAADCAPLPYRFACSSHRCSR
jgi:hypothetical protein